jgi:hypothetical protein
MTQNDKILNDNIIKSYIIKNVNIKITTQSCYIKMIQKNDNGSHKTFERKKVKSKKFNKGNSNGRIK